MQQEVGSLFVEDCFWLTHRGWVLAGKLLGHVATGNQLAFPEGTTLSVGAVEAIRVRDGEKIGLVINEGPPQDRRDLFEKHLVGATAQILAQNA